MELVIGEMRHFYDPRYARFVEVDGEAVGVMAAAPDWNEVVAPLRGLRTIWVHAVSVGEVRSAAPLILALADRYPQHRLVVTTMTPTGSAQVRDLCGDRVTVYLALDADGRVADIRFQGKGCAISQASASLMTELLAGKPMAEAEKLMEGFLHLVKGEPVLIIFVDTIFDADLSIIPTCTDDGIIWTKEVEDYQRFGVVVTDASGHMTRIVEKPKTPVSKRANIGLYYIRNSALLYEGITHTLAQPANQGEFYLTDAFQYMIDHGAKLRVVDVAGWYDAGKLDTLLDTNRVMLEKGRARRPADVQGATILEPVDRKSVV